MSDEGQLPTVFLSYSHADQAAADRIAAALSKAGHTVWWDTLIEGGARFSARIREALDAADAVVVLWSKASIDSDWVCDEASQGRDRHRLVPVTLDGSKPPLGFRQYQTISFAGWRGSASAAPFVALTRAIQSAAKGEPVRAAGPVAGQPGPVVTRRTALMAGGAAAVAVAGVGAWQAGVFGGDRNTNSIAVLPFRELGDSKEAYLSEGITEQVRAALSRIGALKVLGATSSTAAQEGAADPKAVAAKLGVAYLLDGSVQRAGEIVRVAVSLTDGKTGFSTWTQSLDRKLSDVFALQSEIARMVATAMSVRLATSNPVPGGTTNVRAYEEYLKGRSLYLATRDEASDRQAVAHFELAVAADPNFALAHAGLSRGLASIAASSAAASELKGLYDRAIAEAERAVAIAPNLAEGQLALAYALWSGRLDMEAARPAYDKAAQLGAGDADILLSYALFTVRQRRFGEARDAIGRALVLDPLNPRTWRAAGSISLASGDPREALVRYDKALAINPEISNANALKGYAYIELKDWPAAKAALAKEKSGMFRLTGQAILAAKTGNRGQAEKYLAELVASEGDAALYQQAQVLSQWGRNGEALDRLEKARVVGDSGLTAMAVDPFMAPIRGEPRFKALARSIGFA